MTPAVASGWRCAWYFARTGGVPRRSFRVALVVGTVLCLINQGDALFSGAPISWPKLALTYVVPYLVSTYGAVTAHLAMAEGAQSR